MSHTTEHWTAERVRALPDDGNRYELIDGALIVTPAPRGVHQVAIVELVERMGPWLHESGAGWLLFSPADLSLGEDEVLQPDLYVYRTATGNKLRDWSDITALLLVVEVLSPLTARHDRQLKRRRYQRGGVPEYWIADLDSRLFELWRPGDERPEVVSDRLVWEPVAGQSGFAMDAVAYFASVWGE